MVKLLSYLLPALILLGACSHAPDANVQSLSDRGSVGAPKAVAGVFASDSYLYGRGFLTEEEQSLYDRLWEACARYDIDFRCLPPVGMDKDAFAVLASYFSDDNPAYYWAQPVWAETDDGVFVELALCGDWTVEELRQRDAEIEQAARTILADTIPGTPECAYAVHDRLVERVSYDGGNLREDSENIYGALVKRYAICDGYARAYQFLMQRSAVDCVWFRGSSARGIPHAWNAVRLRGDWYYVDVTWDAIDPWRSRTFHSYLGLTYEEVLRSHRFDADQYPALPQGDNRTCNYYHYYGFTVEPEPGDEVRQLAKAFTERLEAASVSQGPERVFLDIKVYAEPEEYERVKELFIRELNTILREMDRQQRQRGSAVELTTDGEIRCNFSDEQQVLILLPVAAMKQNG